MEEVSQRSGITHCFNFKRSATNIQLCHFYTVMMAVRGPTMAPELLTPTPPPPLHPVSVSCSPSSSLWNYLPPPPRPTVPCVGTGLSSEVTLTLARAPPIPLACARKWLPAHGRWYGWRCFSIFLWNTGKDCEPFHAFRFYQFICTKQVRSLNDTLLAKLGANSMSHPSGLICLAF